VTSGHGSRAPTRDQPREAAEAGERRYAGTDGVLAAVPCPAMKLHAW